jgi:hypothetical protein
MFVGTPRYCTSLLYYMWYTPPYCTSLLYHMYYMWYSREECPQTPHLPHLNTHLIYPTF